jgi:hypothetical protein
MNALTNLAIAFCWAVDPLAFNVLAPPQSLLAEELPEEALPWEVVLLSLPQPDNASVLVARIPTAAP